MEHSKTNAVPCRNTEHSNTLQGLTPAKQRPILGTHHIYTQSIRQAGVRAAAEVNGSSLLREDPGARPEVINISSDGNQDSGMHCPIKLSASCSSGVSSEVTEHPADSCAATAGMPGCGHIDWS